MLRKLNIKPRVFIELRVENASTHWKKILGLLLGGVEKLLAGSQSLSQHRKATVNPRH